MSRKAKRPNLKPSQPKQTLPLPEKAIPNAEFSKNGLTDKFYRFNGTSMGGLVLREVSMPGGNVYKDLMTPEHVALREYELKKYSESASKFGISVVNHQDFFAQKSPKESVKLWTVAEKAPGERTLHDLFVSGDQSAFEHQKRVMRASAEYVLNAAEDESRSVIATDLLKPSQFVVGECGELTMVDTNPPLWNRSTGIDNTLSEIFLQAMGMNILTQELEAIDIGIGAITALADTGLVGGSIKAITNTTYAFQNYPPDHPQIQLMQKASLDLLLERPIV